MRVAKVVEAARLERTSLAKWILFTAGGAVIGLFVAFPVAYICQPFLWPGKEVNLPLAPSAGAVVGCAQWLMLRKRFAVRGWWVPASAVGVGSPFVIGEILCRAGFLPEPRGIVGLLCVTGLGIASGLFSGVLQMPLLRPHVAKSGWWIVASSIGWGIFVLAFATVASGTLVGIFMGTFGGIMGGSPIVAMVVTGSAFFVNLIMGPILLGVVTGVGLLWMPRLPVQKRHDAVEPLNR